MLGCISFSAFFIRKGIRYRRFTKTQMLYKSITIQKRIHCGVLQNKINLKNIVLTENILKNLRRLNDLQRDQIYWEQI